MPVLVVDPLEAVEIHHQHAETGVDGSLRPVERAGVPAGGVEDPVFSAEFGNRCGKTMSRLRGQLICRTRAHRTNRRTRGQALPVAGEESQRFPEFRAVVLTRDLRRELAVSSSVERHDRWTVLCVRIMLRRTVHSGVSGARETDVSRLQRTAAEFRRDRRRASRLRD
nr:MULTISPECIES: hypothetical protein [Amycolatopsis]